MTITSKQHAEVVRTIETARAFMQAHGRSTRGRTWLRHETRPLCACSPLIADEHYIPVMEKFKPLYLLEEVRASGFLVGVPDGIARRVLHEIALSCNGAKSKWDAQFDDIIARLDEKSDINPPVASIQKVRTSLDEHLQKSF